jgi:hypothetical protein
MGRLKTHEERQAKALRKKQEEIQKRRQAIEEQIRLGNPLLPMGNQKPFGKFK